ncbi:MAG: hypothetical protein PHX08_16420 [Lachnospiraceae bacterium]|nr:hypothetical protein [Lachnospiraceae bacterium]
MTIKYLKELDREMMQDIILKISEIMSEEQCEKLEKMIEEYAGQISAEKEPVFTRISQEFVGG